MATDRKDKFISKKGDFVFLTPSKGTKSSGTKKSTTKKGKK